VVNNGDVHEVVKNALKILPPEMYDNITLNEKISRSGKFNHLIYGITDCFGEVTHSNGIKTKLELQINAVNVHGSRAVTVLASFKDEMCGNQVIYSTEAATQAHTIGYDPEVLEDFIMNRVMKAPKDIRTLQNWAHKEVRETDLRRILYSNPQISSGAVAAIVKQFNTIEVLKRGSNLLALLSAITSWGSHNNDDFRVRNSGNTDNEAEVLFARQEKIAKLLGSDAFLQVAA